MARGLLAVLIGLMALATAALAASDEERKACEGKDPVKAIAACSRIIESKTGKPSEKAAAYNNRGVAYGRRGDRERVNADYDRATADFDEAIKLKPDFADAYSGRGVAFQRKHDHDRAFANYDQAIKLNPGFAKAYSNRGSAHENKGDHDRAIADYNQAIKLNPNDAIAYTNRGESLNNKGDHNRAIADYDTAIKLNPDDAAAYYGRGLSYFAKGDRVRAALDYDRAQTKPADKQDEFGRQKQKGAEAALKALLDAPAAPAPAASPAQPPLRRAALLIANSKYAGIKPLANPAADIVAVKTALEGLGFDVTMRSNLDHAGLRTAFRQFETKVRAERPDWAVVYFSGHGTETINGAWMLPIDILVEREGEQASDVTLEEDAVSVQNVMLRLQAAKSLRLVIYDACRDNPALSRFNRVLAQAKGLSGANRATGMGWGHDGVIFATAPGTFAQDGQPGQLSPFAESFVSALTVPGLELKDLINRVRDEVRAKTAQHNVVPQVPDMKGFPLDGAYYFRP